MIDYNKTTYIAIFIVSDFPAKKQPGFLQLSRVAPILVTIRAYIRMHPRLTMAST